MPGKIVAIEGEHGTVDFAGAQRRVNLTLVAEPRVGEYVLVHAGFALNRVDEEEARRTLALWAQLAAGREADRRR